jgi:hypothetical protein
MAVGREAVNRICYGRINKKLNGIVSTHSRFDNRGKVYFEISDAGFKIYDENVNEIIAFHKRELISFATKVLLVSSQEFPDNYE